MVKGRLCPLHERHIQIVLRHKQTTFGDPLRCNPLQLAGKLLRGLFAGKCIPEGAADARDLLGRLMDELEAEMADAGAPPVVQVHAGFLRLRAKNRVAAAHIGHHGIGASIYVAQRHAMRLARVAAVFVAGACRQKTAEDAVFGVEHSQVLVGHDLQLSGSIAPARSAT